MTTDGSDIAHRGESTGRGALGTAAPSRSPDEVTAFPWHIRELGIADIWDRGRTNGADARVAVIDTGVADLPCLSGARVRHVDTFGDEVSAGDVDPHGHGTMCASVIGSNDPLSIGIAPGVQIVDIRTGNTRRQFAELDVADALQVALREDCDVVSCSFVLPEISQTFFDAVRALRQEGIFLVGAAGLDRDPQTGFPERTPYCLAVSALDRHLRPLGGGRTGDWIDIAAPGEDIVVATPDDRIFTGFGESSAAAALVSGVLAVMLSAARIRGRYHDVAAVLLAELAASARPIAGAGQAAGAGAIDPLALFTRLERRMV